MPTLRQRYATSAAPKNWRQGHINIILYRCSNLLNEEHREDMADMVKRCARCRLELPTHSFTKDRGASDGPSPRCCGCQEEVAQERQAAVVTHKVCADCGQRKSARE